MGILQDLFTGGASNLVQSVGGVLDNVITTKEEKMTLELEMKKAQFQYETDMKRLSNDEQKMYLDDTGSARTMNAEVQKSENATKLAKNISPILAILTTLLTFFLFYVIIFRQDSQMVQDKKDIIIYILGALSAIVTQIFSFYFGSSQGSAHKNQLIEKHLEASRKSNQG